jgi:hypothetical protein
MKDPVIAGEVKWRRFPGVWGLETLPVRFTPRAALAAAAAEPAEVMPD